MARPETKFVSVADLVGATDYELRDRGEHELKGVPGRWQLFTVDT
jgi:hypothetical protein